MNLLLALLLLVASNKAWASSPSDTVSLATQAPRSIVDMKPLTVAGGIIAPMIIYDVMHFHQDASVRRMRYHYLPENKAHWDDYAQFAPLATTWGMRLAGLEGRSQSHWEAASAHALSYGIGLGITYAGKLGIKRIRPDGSDRRSFPSGHTMAAFAGATILDAEYGSEYPWVSTLGYTVAIATGIGRIHNNRHNATDVIAGAGVGIFSTYAGYLINDLIWGRGLERFSLDIERENNESPAFIKMSKGRHTLLKSLENYTTSNMGSVLSLDARYPVYRQVGIRLGGKLWDSYNVEDASGVNGYALTIGADFMQGLWKGRLWIDGGIATGYHSSINLSKGALSQPRSQSTALTKAGVPILLNGGLSFIATDRLALNLNTEYIFLPTAKLQGFGISMGMAYLLNL